MAKITGISWNEMKVKISFCLSYSAHILLIVAFRIGAFQVNVNNRFQAKVFRGRGENFCYANSCICCQKWGPIFSLRVKRLKSVSLTHFSWVCARKTRRMKKVPRANLTKNLSLEEIWYNCKALEAMNEVVLSDLRSIWDHRVFIYWAHARGSSLPASWHKLEAFVVETQKYFSLVFIWLF